MRLCLLFVFFSTSLVLPGQEKSRVTLENALKHFELSDGLQFSYDPEVVNKVLVTFDFQALDFQSFTTKVEDSFPITISQIKDNYYSLGITNTFFELQVSDADEDSEIPLEAINVVAGNKPIPFERTSEKIVFPYRPDPSENIEVFALGYEKRQITYQELLNNRAFNLILRPPTVELSNVVILDYLTQGINVNPYEQSVSIKTDDLPLVPGETDGDIFASITALPGVNSPDSRAGNLYIRNSYVDQSLILYEGIPIYHRGHYFGTISPYNPKVIDEVTVHRSGFHPRHGGRVGGAVEIKSTSNPLPEGNYGLGANSFYGMGFLKAPIQKDRLSISVGVRHSYPGSFESPKLRSISEMIFDATGVVDMQGNIIGDINTTFQDAHTKVNWKLNEQNTVTFSGIFTRSLAEYGLGRTADEEVENTFSNLGAHLSWRSQLSNRVKSTFALTTSNYTFKFLTDDARISQTPDVFGNFSVNEIIDLGVSEEFQIAINDLDELQIGLDYKRQDVSFDYKSPPPIDSLSEVLLSDKTVANLMAPYANFYLNSINRLSLEVGLRATYYSVLEDFRIAPRIFGNYELNDWVYLKGSAGRYYQYLSQAKNLEFTGGGFDNELWLLADEGTASIIDGNQFMLGTLFNLGSWIIDIEAYSKTANNVTYYPRPRFELMLDFFTADHRAMGVDLLVKRKVSDKISLWAGYTISQAEVSIDSADNIYYTDKFSQPSLITLGGSYINNRWKISVGWRYASGLFGQPVNILPVINNLEAAVAQAGPGMPPPRNALMTLSTIPERFDPVHSLDLSASYTIPKNENRNWSASIGLSLINVYNQNNLTDQVVRGRPPVFLDREAISFAPNMMLIIEW